MDQSAPRPLHLRVNVDGTDWDLVTVHLKSKLLTFPGGRFAPDNEDQRARFGAYALFRRAAEAATVRVYADTVLDGHGQDRPLIILGDLNDTPQAATTQLLYGPPGRNSTPVDSTIPTRATPGGCGPLPRNSQPSTGSPGSSKANRN